MSSVEYLRAFVNERLTAAAEEIFRVFKKTVIEYEEEIDRQRKLLDIVWKPEIQLHRIDLPQQHGCTKEEVLANQQLCIQERNSSPDQEDPEPPRIKEEPEEEPFVLKQVTDAATSTSTYKESDHGEPDTKSDQQLLSHNCHVAESQDQKGGKHGHSESTTNAKPELNKSDKSKSPTNDVYDPTLSMMRRNTQTGKTFFQCDTCGKIFQFKSQLNVHLRSHTQEKPHSCGFCGRRFGEKSSLNAHIRIHTGEKPYACKTCGKGFRSSSKLTDHTRIHTAEKPYPCMTCGRAFRQSSALTVHMRIHTAEKPYICQICGRAFRQSGALTLHMTVHTGEKPYTCQTCGRAFSRSGHLTVHMRTHTGEKPYSCQTCGREFICCGDLTIHTRRAHTGEKPYLCKICGKRFCRRYDLTWHTRSHTDK